MADRRVPIVAVTAYPDVPPHPGLQGGRVRRLPGEARRSVDGAPGGREVDRQGEYGPTRRHRPRLISRGSGTYLSGIQRHRESCADHDRPPHLESPARDPLRPAPPPAAAAAPRGRAGRAVLNRGLALDAPAAPARPGPDGVVPVETLTALVRSYNPKSDSNLIAAAYEYGRKMHGGQIPTERRALFQPPGRGRGAARRAEARRRDDRHGAAARHHRGHALDLFRDRAALRRRGGAAGRRGDQADEPRAFVGRERAGRELPQAPDGDVEGPAGAAGQARRPPAQHAHHQASRAREAAAQGARDHGHLRAARRPDGHAVDARGARGHRLPHPAARGAQVDHPPLRQAAPRDRAT